MTITLSGLRVYINSPTTEVANVVDIKAPDDQVDCVFYSRRGQGPIYRWLYEKKLAHWRALRMNPTEFNVRRLSMASWKTVPKTLQTQIGEHYLE